MKPIRARLLTNGEKVRIQIKGRLFWLTAMFDAWAKNKRNKRIYFQQSVDIFDQIEEWNSQYDAEQFLIKRFGENLNIDPPKWRVQ